MHPPPPGALALPIPQVVNELPFSPVCFSCTFDSLCSHSIGPGIVHCIFAQGYKVSNTIEPAKTDDCHSQRGFHIHMCPKAGKRAHIDTLRYTVDTHTQKKHHHEMNPMPGLFFLFFPSKQTRARPPTNCNQIKHNERDEILTAAAYCSLISPPVLCTKHSTQQSTRKEGAGLQYYFLPAQKM